GRPRRLGQDVVDAGRFQDGPAGAAGDDPGPGGGGLEEDPAGAVLPDDLVGDGRAGQRHRDEVLLGLLDALLDGRRHLLGLAEPEPDLAGAVATTTRAENENRRPPLTTLATRRISMTRSSY